MVYRLGLYVNRMITVKGCLAYIVVLVVLSTTASWIAAKQNSSGGLVISTTPREFMEFNPATPTKVISSCIITVEYKGKYSKEIREMVDSGCIYKPGERIGHHLDISSLIYNLIMIIICGFILIAAFAIFLPKYPTITIKQ